jgi:hypothetical protein
MRFRPRLEFWLLALAILCAAPARSEPTIQDRLNAAFAGLDVELRTGVLYDRVLPLSGIERFDGAATSPAATRATWRQMYDELRRASIAPNTPPLAVVLLAGARR